MIVYGDVFLLLSYSQKALFIPSLFIQAHVIKTMAMLLIFTLHSPTIYALGKYDEK